jgi:bifunctional ADP-heptose synthase (sugar kinase/adenylyltransferase)
VSTTKRIAIFAGLIVVACVGVIVRRFLGPERPIVNFQSRNFMVEAAVTVLALVWWQLVAYGVFQKVRGENE